jgi:hypothetical protein
LNDNDVPLNNENEINLTKRVIDSANQQFNEDTKKD